MTPEGASPVDPASSAAQSVNNATSQPSATSSNEEINGASTFSSLADFRKRAPELHDRFMQTIAEAIIKDMKKGQERVKKAMKKMREN